MSLSNCCFLFTSCYQNSWCRPAVCWQLFRRKVSRSVFVWPSAGVTARDVKTIHFPDSLIPTTGSSAPTLARGLFWKSGARLYFACSYARVLRQVSRQGTPGPLDRFLQHRIQRKVRPALTWGLLLQSTSTSSQQELSLGSSVLSPFLTSPSIAPVHYAGSGTPLFRSSC